PRSSPSFPTRRSSDLLLLGSAALPAMALDAVGQRYVDQLVQGGPVSIRQAAQSMYHSGVRDTEVLDVAAEVLLQNYRNAASNNRSEEHTSELQSRENL